MPVLDFGGDIGAGVLMQGVLDGDDVLALAYPQFATDIVKAAELDEAGNRAGGFLDSPVDDEGVDLVGEGAGLAVVAVVANLPLEGSLCPEAVLLTDLNLDTSSA